MTAERWRRVCTVLDRVHDTGPDVRDAILEAACREHGLSVDDVKPFVDAGERSAALPEEIPFELIENAFGDSAEELRAPMAHTDRRYPEFYWYTRNQSSTSTSSHGHRAQGALQIDVEQLGAVAAPHRLMSAGRREHRALATGNSPHGHLLATALVRNIGDPFDSAVYRREMLLDVTP
jgi:hypothetical protein